MIRWLLSRFSRRWYFPKWEAWRHVPPPNVRSSRRSASCDYH
jgi:hypothetical protein